MRITKTKTRIEYGEEVTYIVVDESYEDDYGSLKSDYVPYRIHNGIKTRLSPVHYCLSQFEAEQYIVFGEWKICECCRSRYFKHEE